MDPINQITWIIIGIGGIIVITFVSSLLYVTVSERRGPRTYSSGEQWTVYVERISPQNEFTFDDLRFTTDVHLKCFGGRIEVNKVIGVLSDRTDYCLQLFCQRCNEVVLWHLSSETKLSFMKTAMDGEIRHIHGFDELKIVAK